MTPHSANDTTNPYIGTRLINGVLSHVWLDGRTIALFSGGAGDGDDGGGDGDADGDGDDSDDGDDSEDDDGKGGKGKGKSKDDDDDDDDDINSKNPAIRRSARQAAKYRVRAKTNLTRAETAETALAASKAEVADLKKNGAGDAVLKKDNEALLKENADLKAQVATGKAKEIETTAYKNLNDAIAEFNLDIDDDALWSKLKRNGMLTIDPEDGEIEDLSKSIKKLLKDKSLKKKAVSDGEEGEEGDESGAPSKASGSPVTRGGKNRTRTPSAADLAKKYPALRR